MYLDLLSFMYLLKNMPVDVDLTLIKIYEWVIIELLQTIDRAKQRLHFYILAWVPSFDWSIYYPNTTFNQTPWTKNTPVRGLPCSPIKLEAKGSRGFIRYDQISKQTNRDYFWINIDIDIVTFM